MKLTTYAEEQAARIQAEDGAPFVPTHTYDPIGWDRFDPRGIEGYAIQAGVPVQLMAERTKGLHQGMPAEAKRMFNTVRDAQGNRQNVNRKSLVRLVKG